MQLNLIPDEVLDNVRERGFTDAQIEGMSVKQLFDEFCMWEGLIHYGEMLWDTVEKLQEAEKQHKETQTNEEKK